MSEPVPPAVLPPLSPDEEVPTAGHLHPAVMVLWPLPQLVPLLFLLLSDTVPSRFVGAGAVAVLVAGVVRWWRFRWRIEAGSLIIEQGLVARRVRTLPLERIQRVDVVRRLRHRLLGVSELVIEAIGGDEPEGKLDALPVEVAERLRATLLAGGPTGVAAEVPGQILATVTPRKLLVAGLTGGRVGVAAALLGGLDQLAGDRWWQLFGALPSRLGVTGTITAAALLLVAAFALSVAATVVVSWGFTVRRHDHQLVIERGLLARRQETIPLARIQALRVEDNLLRRPWGLAAVNADLAGRSGDAPRHDRGTVLPIGTRAEGLKLAAEVLDRTQLAAPVLHPAPGAARRRRWTRALAAVAAVTAAAVALGGPAGLAALALALPAGAAAEASYRALGWGRAGDVLLARSGLLVRRTSMVPLQRVQSLALTASPSQRLAGLATLHLQIARSPGSGRGHRWIDVDVATAFTALSQLATELSAPPASAPPTAVCARDEHFRVR